MTTAAKKHRSAIEELVYQSLHKAEKILLDLAATAECVETSEKQQQPPKPAEMTCSAMLDGASTQAATSSASSSTASSYNAPTELVSMSPSRSQMSLCSKHQQQSTAEDGIVMDLNVKVHNPAEKKNIQMSIECPNYEPKRIFFGGKWLQVKPAASE